LGQLSERKQLSEQYLNLPHSTVVSSKIEESQVVLSDLDIRDANESDSYTIVYIDSDLEN